MDNVSDEDILNAHPGNQAINLTEGDSDVAKAISSHPASLLNQSRFWVVIEEGALAVSAILPRELSYFEWSIVTDPLEIDGDREDGSHSGDMITDSDSEYVLGAKENGDPKSMVNEDEESGPDETENLEESGRNLADKETPLINLCHTNICLLVPSPLKGYEYTTFNPTPINHSTPGTAAYKPHPTQPDVLTAMEDLEKILHLRHDTGQGYKDLEIDLWRCAWLEGMMSMFCMFTNPQSCTYNQWGASASQTAIGMG